MNKVPVLIVFGVLVLITCAPLKDNSEPAAPVGETVSLNLDARFEGDALKIEGATDLPDGALVGYEVSHEMAATVPYDQLPAENMQSRGTAPVASGTYTATVSIKNWPAGNVHVFVCFPTAGFPDAKQPDEVISRYGETGENLTGENVSQEGPFKRVELTADLSLAG